MRVNKNARRGGSNYGLADIMKLVIAVVFTLVFALLNITEPKPHTATITVSDTASALAPPQTRTKKEQPKPAAAEQPQPQPKQFNADDQSTWPKCAAGQIVRADNGQCATPAQPQAAATPAAVDKPAPAPQGSVEAIIRSAAAKYGLDGDYMVRLARCESTLNPNAVNYNYYENGHPSGLYQHLSGYWPARAAKYGHAGASVFDAQANADVTAGMIRDGGAGLWECKG